MMFYIYEKLYSKTSDRLFISKNCSYTFIGYKTFQILKTEDIFEPFVSTLSFIFMVMWSSVKYIHFVCLCLLLKVVCSKSIIRRYGIMQIKRQLKRVEMPFKQPQVTVRLQHSERAISYSQL